MWSTWGTVLFPFFLKGQYNIAICLFVLFLLIFLNIYRRVYQLPWSSEHMDTTKIVRRFWNEELPMEYEMLITW